MFMVGHLFPVARKKWSVSWKNFVPDIKYDVNFFDDLMYIGCNDYEICLIICDYVNACFSPRQGKSNHPSGKNMQHWNMYLTAVCLSVIISSAKILYIEFLITGITGSFATNH